MSSEIELLAGSALEAANAVYASIHFTLSDAQHDRTYGLLEARHPVALGRIQRYADGELEIGGFWVHAERRGTGLARRVVQHVLSQLPDDQRAWCIPFERLESFYKSFALRRADPAGAPAGVRAKLDYCAKQAALGRYPPVCLLVRDASD